MDWGLAELAHLAPSGQAQIAACLRMPAALEAELTAIRHRLPAAAAALRGAKALADALYGVGPVTAVAFTCWLGRKDRFSSARKAAWFCGLDITVYSSDDKRLLGHPGGALVRL